MINAQFAAADAERERGCPLKPAKSPIAHPIQWVRYLVRYNIEWFKMCDS